MSLAAYASKTNKYYYAYVLHVNTSMISSKYTCVEFVFNLISKLLIMAKKISHSIILFS